MVYLVYETTEWEAELKYVTEDRELAYRVCAKLNEDALHISPDDVEVGYDMLISSHFTVVEVEQLDYIDKDSNFSYYYCYSFSINENEEIKQLYSYPIISDMEPRVYREHDKYSIHFVVLPVENDKLALAIAKEVWEEAVRDNRFYEMFSNKIVDRDGNHVE